MARNGKCIPLFLFRRESWEQRMPNTITVYCNGPSWQADVAPVLRILYGVARKRFGRGPDGEDRTQAAILDFCEAFKARWRPGVRLVLAFRYSMLRPSEGRMATGERASGVRWWRTVRLSASPDVMLRRRQRSVFLRYTDRDLVNDVRQYSRFAAAIVERLLAGKTVSQTAREMAVNTRRVWRGVRSALRRVGYPVAL